MRLLVITPFYKPAYVYGGPPRSISALCEEFVNLGNPTTVITTNANGRESLKVDTNRFYDLEGVRVRYFSRDIPGNYFFSRSLSQFCYEHITDYDLVYVSSNWGFPFLPACRAAYKARVPYIVTPRTSFMRKTWIGKYLKKKAYHYGFERRLINKASAIHYTSELEVAESKWLNLTPPFFIVPNPVSLKEFESMPLRGKFRERWRIDFSTSIILFLGRIEPRKGIDITLKALAKIVSDYPKAKLVLSGPEEDDYLKTVQNMSDELGISRQVLITGYLGPSERLDALRDADIFILTSYSENFGMAVVEAMASGLPVIISEKVGIADVIRQGRAGLVTSLVPTDVALALRMMLSDKKKAMQMGDAGKIVARRNFSPGVVAQKMLGEFNKILLAKRSG